MGNLLEVAANAGRKLNQVLHHLLRYCQHESVALRLCGRIMLMACKHTIIAHIFATAQDSHRYWHTVWPICRKFKLPFEDTVNIAPILAFVYYLVAGSKG